MKHNADNQGFYVLAGATKSGYIFRLVTSNCLRLLLPCLQRTKIFRSVVFWPLLTMRPAIWWHYLKSLKRNHKEFIPIALHLIITITTVENWCDSEIWKDKNKPACLRLTKHLWGSRMAAIDVSQTDPTINRSRHNTGFPLIDSIDVVLFCFTQSSPKGGSVLQMFGSK